MQIMQLFLNILYMCINVYVYVFFNSLNFTDNQCQDKDSHSVCWMQLPDSINRSGIPLVYALLMQNHIKCKKVNSNKHTSKTEGVIKYLGLLYHSSRPWLSLYCSGAGGWFELQPERKKKQNKLNYF